MLSSSFGVSASNETDDDFMSPMGPEIWDENSSMETKSWNANSAITTASTVVGGLGMVWESAIENGDGKSIYVGEFIYSLSEDGSIITMEKRMDDGELIWKKEISDDVDFLSKDSIWQGGDFIYTVAKYGYPHYSVLSKWDSEGVLIWNSTLDRIWNPSIWGDDEYVYVSGEEENRDLYLSKIHPSNGSVIWDEVVDFVYFNVAGVWINDENIYVFGDDARDENVLINFSKNGSIVWIEEIEYGFYGFYSKSIWGNKDALFSATSFDYGGLPRSVVTKWDFDGSIVWHSNYTESDGEYINSVWANDQELYSFGTFERRWDPDSFSLIRWNISDGSVVWKKEWDMQSSIEGFSVRGKGENLYTIGSTSIIKWMYDLVSPTINDHANVHYEQLDSVFSLRWTAYDESPASYTIFKDSYEIESGNWISGETIEIEINQSSALGQYNYTIVVEDLSGNRAMDTSVITIEDTISPLVSLNYSNDTIVWTAEDRNPDSYSIYENGMSIFSGNWVSGGEISIIATPEEQNSLNYTSIIQDTSGNSESNTIIIPPLELSGDTPPNSWGIWLTIIGLAVLIVVAILLKGSLDDSKEKSPTL